jgi:hypothetical protein
MDHILVRTVCVFQLMIIKMPFRMERANPAIKIYLYRLGWVRSSLKKLMPTTTINSKLLVSNNRFFIGSI